jgi:hypothetical protein
MRRSRIFSAVKFSIESQFSPDFWKESGLFDAIESNSRVRFRSTDASHTNIAKNLNPPPIHIHHPSTATKTVDSAERRLLDRILPRISNRYRYISIAHYTNCNYMTSTITYRSPVNRQLDRVKNQHLLNRLDRRLAAAIERGDRILVAQLTTELSDLTASM